MKEEKRNSELLIDRKNVALKPMKMSKVQIVVSNGEGTCPLPSEKGYEDAKSLKKLPPLSRRQTPDPLSRRSRNSKASYLENTTKPIIRGAHNRFHYNCCDKKPQSLDDVRARSQLNAIKRRKSNQLSARPVSNDLLRISSASTSSLVSYNQECINASSSLIPDYGAISAFLKNQPEFLEDFVLKNLDFSTIQRWYNQKKSQLTLRDDIKTQTSSLSPWKPSINSYNRFVFTDLKVNLENLYADPDDEAILIKIRILEELGRCISGAISAYSFKVYLVNDKNYTELIERFIDNGEVAVTSVQPICLGTTVAAFAAKNNEIVRTRTSIQDDRFPKGVIGIEGNYSVLSHPILREDSLKLEGLLEFIKPEEEGSFSEEDEKIVNSYLIWGEVSIYYSEMLLRTEKQMELSDFLLTTVKSFFTEITSIDSTIRKVMHFAHKLVNADRASLFLVDSKTNQLYARIFDVKCVHEERNSEEMDNFIKEIRFPIGTGIAGYVAKTGEILNVVNAYEDIRFNKGIDELTGYTTNSVLCMPITIYGNVIGIIQMINKKNGIFTKEDERIFEIFSAYCGLTLHHAKLYDKIRRSEQKYKVSLEVLSYHNSTTEMEVEEFLNEGDISPDPHLYKFHYYAMDISDKSKIQNAIYMFMDLFGDERFDYDTLVRFIITVKKNYRDVSYHNWSHGFHVANSIYTIIKSSPNVFRPLECLSMFVGGLCHDLDHRGFNNKYMIDIESPLAAIYTTSTMEHHHFNMTVNILQNEKQNIFAKLNPEEYRQVLGNIKHCILATDLALFFPNKAKLNSILKDSSFSWKIPDHRMLVQSILMTGSDVCSVCKPWATQLPTAASIYNEFFLQGDLEKNMGWKPIPLFDRDHAAEIASMQVGFISGICIPCYEFMVKLLPETTPMLEQCKKNLEKWKQKASGTDTGNEEHDEEDSFDSD